MKGVFLVGAGPGDPGLLTRRGAAILERADAVVYDRLIGGELLSLAQPQAQLVYVGKEAGRHALSQEQINELLVELGTQGKVVCRLKGGDPFIFGRGGEELLACLAAGVPCEVVPGVSSAVAAPAYAGIPLTQRGVAASFAVVTGHTADEAGPPASIPHADTLVFLMGIKALPLIVERLLQRGEPPEKPVAIVRWGTTMLQEVVTGTLATIESQVQRSGIAPPALIVVGDVVHLRDSMRWFDNRPLWGKTVVVTRARDQASELADELRGYGARIVACPAIATVKIEDYAAVDGAIAALATGTRPFDWCVWSSANGVAAFWQRLRLAGGDARWLAGARVAAIGTATAGALREKGIEPDLVPAQAVSEAVADGLIERGVAGKRVLLLRALHGRGLLEQRLEAAGARVTLAPCYRTVADASEAPHVRALVESGQADWITFTSSSTVHNLAEAIGADFLLANRRRYRVACLGPITAETARAAGLAADYVAPAPSIALLAAGMAGFAATDSPAP